MAQAGFQSPLPSKWNQEKYLLENSSRDSLCWLEDEQNNYTFLSFQAKLFQNKKQQKYFGNVTVIVNIVTDLSSSDELIQCGNSNTWWNRR